MRLLSARARVQHRLARPVVSLVLLAALGAAGPARSQTEDRGEWRAYPAYNEVTALASGPSAIWAGTAAGVFSYTPSSGEIERYTPVDGLQGGPLLSLAVDPRRKAVWVGYASGVLDRIDTETGAIRAYFGIARAEQYPSRGVRRIEVRGDSLYLSTDFGLVVFDPARVEVRNTYARLAGLPAGLAVNDAVEAPLPDGRPGLWLATAAGVVYAPRDAANLQAPTAWTLDEGLSGETYSLAFFDGGLYVGGGPQTARDLYRRTAAGTWERQLFINNPIFDLVVDGDRLLGRDPSFLYVYRAGQFSAFYDGQPAASALSGVVVGPDGARWAGDAALGLFRLPALTVTTGRVRFTPEPVVPDGPYTSRIADFDVGPAGALWAVTGRIDAPNAQASSVNRFQDGAWTQFLTTDPGIDIGRSTLRSVAVGRDGTAYAGSSGNGLVVFKPDGSIQRYDESNSSLTSPAAAPGFVVVSDVAFEGDRRWVLNLEGSLPLHLFRADGTWAGLPWPGDQIPSTVPAFRLAIDNFGQKWLALGPRGLGVWSTGTDPASPADDQDRWFTQTSRTGRGLPSGDIRDVVFDGRRVWIGTDRGIAYVFSPGSAFSGDGALATPQSPIIEATEGGGALLLGDVEVNDLEVDPAGRIWVATTSGAYLLNEDGTAVVRTLTAASTPLPSDEIFAISVDRTTGRVFLTTAEGLFSVGGDATQAVAGSEALRVSPSPFRPGQSDGVVISGLPTARSAVRILTVSGEVVHAREAAGGSFRWDGRDDRTGQPVRTGVYIVAAASAEGGATVYGKVAVVR